MLQIIKLFNLRFLNLFYIYTRIILDLIYVFQDLFILQINGGGGFGTFEVIGFFYNLKTYKKWMEKLPNYRDFFLSVVI